MSLTDEQRERIAALEDCYEHGYSLPNGLNDIRFLLDLVDSLEKENKQLRNELSHWRRP